MSSLASTAQDIYSQSVVNLPPTEQLRLAHLILKRLVQDKIVIDAADSWNQTDQDDVTHFSLQYADRLYPEEENLI